jgi:hypothetical protein
VRAQALLLTLATLAACGGDDDDDPATPDAAGALADAALPDAAPADAAASAADAAADPADANVGPFGELSGACGVIDTEIDDPFPSRLDSAIAFERLFTEADAPALTDGGREILADGNAGGSSLLSEVFAFELLGRCEEAELVKTETEIVYDQPGAITDLLVSIDGEKLGVSVTRAVGFPFDAPYTVEQATLLLEGKLADILVSTANVSEEDRWRKQILAVLAFAPGHAESLTTALDGIDPAVRADTIVWVLVTDGADDFVYCDGPCD